MVWLMAYLAQHAVQIALIGAIAGAISQVESVAINTTTIIEKAEGK